MEDLFGFFPFLRAPADGKQRGAAASEQVGEGCDDHDDREAESDGAKRRRSHTGNAGNVYAVYDIVKQAHKLRHKHGQGGAEYVFCDGAMCKINSFQSSHFLKRSL